MSPRRSTICAGVATVAANTSTPTRQTSAAGMSRRKRRAQKRFSATDPVR